MNYISAMSTILVPLDTSGIASQVLLAAELLASKLQSKLILLHVIEPMTTYVPMGTSADLIATSPPILDNQQTDGARRRLETLAAPLRIKGLEVDCEALLGTPVDEIADMATAQGADYIVLGSHGHGALYHLFGGSVVTGVLKRSSCPVIVVPVRK